MRPSWFPIVISGAQQQSVGMESGGLSFWLWDPGIYMVGRLLHLLLDRVVIATNLLHSWFIMRLRREFDGLIFSFGRGFVACRV